MYPHASGLSAILITEESSFWIWFPYTLLLPLYITDVIKTSPSSQEVSESSQRLQQAHMASKQNEKGTVPEHVAEVVKPDKGKSLNVSHDFYGFH